MMTCGESWKHCGDAYCITFDISTKRNDIKCISFVINVAI